MHPIPLGIRTARHPRQKARRFTAPALVCLAAALFSWSALSAQPGVPVAEPPELAAPPDEIRVGFDPEGFVTLRGTVRDPEVQGLAAELAGAVPGVAGVRNELTVEPRTGGDLVRSILETHEVIEPRIVELTPDELSGPLGRSRVPRATCVLSNPNRIGWCTEPVELEAGQTAREACLQVLHCLGDPLCVGVYCRNTELRRGWQLEMVVGPEPDAGG